MPCHFSATWFLYVVLILDKLEVAHGFFVCGDLFTVFESTTFEQSNVQKRSQIIGSQHAAHQV